MQEDSPRARAPTFLGMPPFPEAARVALSELEDWEQLRLAGAAIKDEVLANLPRRIPAGEQLAMSGAALVLGRPGRLAAGQRLAGRVLGSRRPPSPSARSGLGRRLVRLP
jgi:hypothetical protein